MKYVCPCGYEYDPAVGDPDNGIAPGTPWEEVAEDWVCPICGLGKDAFEDAYSHNSIHPTSIRKRFPTLPSVHSKKRIVFLTDVANKFATSAHNFRA